MIEFSMDENMHGALHQEHDYHKSNDHLMLNVIVVNEDLMDSFTPEIRIKMMHQEWIIIVKVIILKHQMLLKSF